MALVGIDLGTTNSLISIWRDGSVELIKNHMGNVMTPSVVGTDEDGSFLVGEVAKQRRLSHPDSTVAEFKCKMGTDSTYSLRGKQYRPEEVSALLLKKMIRDAEVSLGEKITEAVISVPAHFNDLQREATRRAARMAGISVKRLVNEPSAAILYKRWKSRTINEEGIWLVVDFGGGTLDVSVVECFENIIEILAVAGDNHLGGKDFDERIARDFCERCNLDFDTLRKSEQEKVLWAAEKTKKALSREPQVIMNVMLGEAEYEVPYDEERLLDVSADLLIKIKSVMDEALTGADVDLSRVTDIIPIGGSCRMPLIQQYLSALLGREVKVDEENRYYVGYGAGVLTGIMEREQGISDIVMTDVCPFSLGIPAYYSKNGPGGRKGDFMDILIPKNSVLPISNKIVRHYKAEKPRLMSIQVFQGENEYAYANLLLGNLVLTVTPGETGLAEVEVVFCYDINGILEVTVNDIHGGKGPQMVELERNARLSPAELRQRHIDISTTPLLEKNKEENKSLVAWGHRLFVQGKPKHRRILTDIIPAFEECLQRNDIIQIRKMARSLASQLAEMEKEINKNYFEEEDLDELLGYFRD